MTLSSLTQERLTKLEAEKAAQDAEINALLCRTAQDLWLADLDQVRCLSSAEWCQLTRST
jgi:hypothetical protein